MRREGARELRSRTTRSLQFIEFINRITDILGADVLSSGANPEHLIVTWLSLSLSPYLHFLLFDMAELSALYFMAYHLL